MSGVASESKPMPMQRKFHDWCKVLVDLKSFINEHPITRDEVISMKAAQTPPPSTERHRRKQLAALLPALEYSSEMVGPRESFNRDEMLIVWEQDADAGTLGQRLLDSVKAMIQQFAELKKAEGVTGAAGRESPTPQQLTSASSNSSASSTSAAPLAAASSSGLLQPQQSPDLSNGELELPWPSSEAPAYLATARCKLAVRDEEAKEAPLLPAREGRTLEARQQQLTQHYAEWTGWKHDVLKAWILACWLYDNAPRRDDESTDPTHYRHFEQLMRRASQRIFKLSAAIREELTTLGVDSAGCPPLVPVHFTIQKFGELDHAAGREIRVAAPAAASAASQQGATVSGASSTADAGIEQQHAAATPPL
jgi:hypothetical protein